MRYAVIGYGRMGRGIDDAARRRGHELVCVVDPFAQGRRVHRRLGVRALERADVAFEFTTPATAEANVLALLKTGCSVVCGTTGWDYATPRIRRAVRSSGAGAVIAPNFSLGMNLFYEVVRESSRLLCATGLYDPFVYEIHHRGKVDAPSGTANRLATIIGEASPAPLEIRVGDPGDRPIPRGAIHVVSARAGHEPGSHTVGFDGEHDVVRLTHAARGRGGFTLGAVLAGEWIAGRKGLHGFHRVLRDLLKKGGRM